MQSGNARFLFGFGPRLVLLAFVFAFVSFVQGQVADLNELSEDEQKQVEIAERFVTVLEKNPRRGTALDRIYGHHVEFGTLDDFMQSLRDRVQETPNDGTGWMLLGLFEAHRGEDANAIDALRKAEEFRPDDALASYYLGQSLLLLGQPEEAVAAFERAIERNPRRTDLLEIFQQLGRVHQRAQRTEEALAVWQRLEALFPDDPRVQEQIAVTLVEEGEYALALPRYANLAKLVRDDYRRTMFRIEAAELKIRVGRRDEGIADFESLLADLNPESWLHRDVRRRVEDVFLRSGNQDGLVSYYEKWIESHADDVDGMARLAKFLASSARVPEATEWMGKALKLAPTRTELRKSFIDQLVDDQRYGEAIQQYELLVESAPGNADFVRDWGKLVLKNKELDQPARHAEAARIWNQILAARPDDALTMSQVADLFRQSNMLDEALALYQRAVAQAPNDPQYREYLGEFYHILKRPDDALATWTAIAEGERHSAINVSRLAEIYNSFGYLEEAVTQIAEACKLDPKDFALHVKASEYHSRARKFDEALVLVGIAENLAANAEEQDASIAQRIDVFRASRRLDEEIDALASKVHGNADSSAEQCHLLARYCEADSRWADATEAIATALKKDAKSIPAITTAARIAESSGDYARAADMNRQLAAVDRRSRGDHLMNVARLEAQMGRADEALEAGRELIVSAPGNTDNYEFYAQLCFQLGKSEVGVDTLRKAVRINPTEPHLIMALGSALSDGFRTDEAIEVYWRAFEKSDDLDDKTSLTMKLTELYLQVNQFDKLLERLERDRREEDKRHAMTICLAQAHHSAGDYGTARQELESLLSENTRDTNLLQQLSKLCEQGSELDGAIEYQRQLATIAPGHETEYRLATLLQARGDRDEASEILVKLMRREEDPARRLRNLDSLLTQGAYESVISITEPLLSEQHDDWELLYREAVAWASLEKIAEAQDRFDRLLALAVAHDAFGVVAEDKLKQAQTQARSNNLRGIQSTMPTRRSPLTMLGMSAQVRQAVGLDPDRGYYSSSTRARPVWTPSAFGEARMAAYAWLMLFDQEQESDEDANEDQSKTLEKRLEELGAIATADGATRESVYDWMYVEQLRGNLDSIFRVARRMAREGGREAQQFFLTSLALRGVDTASQQASRSQNEQPKKAPLSDDDLELMLQCQQALTAASDDGAYAATMGGQVIYASNGQAYIQLGNNYVPLSASLGGGAYVGTIIEELKLAGRLDQAEQLIQKQIESAKSSSQLAVAMNMFLQEEKYDRIDELFPKWLEAARDDIARGPTAATGTSRRSGSASQVVDPMAPAANLLMTWMGHLGPEEEHDKILSILETSLDISTEVAKRKRAEQSRRRTTSSLQPRYSRSYSLKYGKEDIRAQFDYPYPSPYVDATTLTLLREVYEVFNRNEVLEELSTHLQQRLQAAPEDEKLYATLMLAYAHWWLEEKEDALVLLKKAGTYLNDDPAFRLEIATLHQSMGDTEDALEIVEAIVPRDQKLVQQRELMALELAERLGDIDRARQSAERLFGLRLDTNTQLALVDRMRRLGMHEMAEAITSRVERRSGNSLPAMASLMALYQSQGKADLAQQLAHTILRRSPPPLSGMSNAGRNPFRYSSRSSDSQMRTQALRMLQQTGALKDLIARTETQIEKSPNSPRLYEQLIEYYEAANEREKVAGLLAQAIAHRPDAVVFRYQLAKNLESAGKHAEACDQYLEILKLKPQWIAEDLYQVRRVFEYSKRSLDLIQAIENVNLKLFSQPYYVIDLVSNLMDGRRGQQNEDNIELALNLFEKVFEAFPQYRNQMISRMRDQNLWKNDRVFKLGKQAIVPSVGEVAAAPWFGLDNIYSYSSGGQVNAQFHQMLTGIQGSPKMAELTEAIESRLQDAPGWHGGEAMLGLIDLKENRKEQAKERLGKLVSDEETLKAMPAHSCWIIGQELDQFEDTRPIALKLFENALNSPQSTSQIQYSPVARLVKLYGDIGRKQDARDLLIKQANATREINYDPQYASYLRIENSVWAAQQLLELDCPVDAVRLFRGLSTDPTRIEQAGQWYGGQANHFKAQIDQGLQKALAALDSANSEEAMTQLLAVPEKLPAGGSALDLMLQVPDITNLRETSMQSPLVDLLVTISKEDAIADGIRKRLGELRTERADDLSIGVAESAYLMRMHDEHAADALRSLLATVADHPLEQVPPGRRPNSRQRREGLAHIPLWLIARECLKTKEQREAGSALAERALEAARRQTGDQHTAAILYDWGKIAIERGDREQAEAKWSELLDIVVRRPEPKQPATKPRTSSLDRRATQGTDDFVFVHYQVGPAQVVPGEKQRTASRRVPPLTISQFRLTMEIALAAAENDMPALSRKAVKASMLGGTPVPDAASSTFADPFGGTRTVSPSSAANADSSQTESEVAESVRKVIGKWQGDAYPAQEVYELLLPIVFPENRPTEILMYANSTKLDDAQVSSLGADLVQWARTAKQLDDLSQHVLARTRHPQARVAALVLRTQVALAQDKLNDAELALTELAQQVAEGSLASAVQLACHAALPASDHKGLEKPAYDILKAAVNLQLQDANANQNSNQLSLGKLVSKVNLYLVDEPEEVKKFFDSYLVGRQALYSRYSGTYGQYLQWTDWAAIAEEAAKTGLPTVALDYMGRVADFSYENRSRPSTKTALAVACREMSLLSSEKRYEAWRDWTLPVEGRQTIRLAAEWVEPVRVPATFLEARTVRGEPYSGDMICNFTELVTAAQATGHLEELRDLLKPAYDQKLENAAFLYALVLVQLGDVKVGAPVIQPIIDTVGDRLKRQSGQPTPDGWGDYLVYRACMRSAPFASLYANKRTSLQNAFRSISNYQVLSRLNVDYVRHQAERQRVSIGVGHDPQLTHWFPATTNAAEGVDPWWAVQEGHIAHLGGLGVDLMYFMYPLTGEFEFSVDGYKGSWAETDAGYGGIVVEGQSYGSRASVWSTGGHETIYYPQTLQRENGSFGTITIKVADGRMQHLLNNHVVYEEALSDTSPWITLYTNYARATTFRNPRFSGNPVIPREVVLVKGDRMDGWNTSFFGKTQPRHRLMALKPQSENDNNAYAQRQEPTEFDWHAEDGLLLGRAVADSPKSRSWAYYHRPLRDRETFSYEFYYAPGAAIAHPTIGRMALLLEPEGVDEHWITRTGWDQEVLGVSNSNRITNPDARRGAQQLPLKSDDWNRVSLGLVGDTIQLMLNGETIYERLLEPEVDHRFGLFHRQGQSLKVREPKLSGTWPASLTEDIRIDLLASTKQYTSADRRLINTILSEDIFEQDVARILSEVKELPPEQAYEKLLTWVLPSPDHPRRSRLYYEFESAGNADAGRAQRLRCPALELMALAEQLGKLADLTKAIDAINISGDLNQRGKIALATLAAIQSGDLELAHAQMADLNQYLLKGLSKNVTARDRAAEFLVAWQAVKHPALQFAAFDIATELVNRQRDQKFKKNDPHWDASVNILAGHVDRAMLASSFGSASAAPLTQWANIPYVQPNVRTKGLAMTEWLYRPGIVQHIPGGTLSQLFFQSPLQGKFEIAAEASMLGYRDVAIAYGMHSAIPRYDFKAHRVMTLMQANRDVDGILEIPDKSSWVAQFRIAVNDDTITTFVNGVQIHEEKFASRPDPWAVLQAYGPGYSSTVRNLRIVGNPEIPDEIDLIDFAGFGSWRADVYGESLSLDAGNTTATWKKSGDEILGQLRQNVAAANVQSLLMYQRPMLEDGVIEFESFYVPDEFTVHPAIGRMALIVGPDGVRTHWLTDAQYDTSDVAPDNAASIEGAAGSVDLKPNEWNRYKLSLAGDQLTLSINAAEVATVTLTESSTERFFGLFRYSDKTKCRVRHLVYRGNWPKTLPAVEDQQLARPSAPNEFANWSAPRVFEFSNPKDKLQAAGLVIAGPADRSMTTDRGLRMIVKESTGYGSWPRIHLREPIAEDFVVTLDFEQLTIAPPKAGWGSVFVLRAVVDSSADMYVDTGVGCYRELPASVNSRRKHKTLSGAERHDGRYKSVPAGSGRLRLVRTGNVISTYFAERDSDAFRPWETWPVGDAPIKEISVEAAASDVAAVLDLVVTRMTLQTRTSP